VENLSLVLASEADLTVKSFVVRESLSAPFDIEIIAYTPADNLPFEGIVGHKASFGIVSPWPEAAPRKWTGIIHRIEQLDAEASGATTYSLRLAPSLWRLGRRTNCRIFQHLSIPEIAAALLAEWEITPTLRLDPAAFARHEYRVQYGETDLAFLSRLLEEAGIAYLFEDPDAPKDEKDEPWSRLVLAEDATRREPRTASLDYWNASELPNDREAVSRVHAAREVRAGRTTIRDFDFRARPRHKLLASATSEDTPENRLETYDYLPGAFVIEPTADTARVDEREAQSRADKALAAQRGGRFNVSYRTNVLDLAPGVVFAMRGHPHPDLADKQTLLVTAQRIEGTRGAEWTVTGQATFGDEPHRPARVHTKPKIAGVQSAFVVGPAGEEIHTDPQGRVRVEFHWDREGKSDEKSSCFLRVSQGWAGPGYGIVAVPRIGEEVLVSFFDGDPDQPVVVGRVHNAAAPAPQALPANKTKTIWRTVSTPGGGGYNELALDDKKGEELVALRAERDYERTILRDERAAIGSSLTTTIGNHETREIKADQTLTIGGSRSVTIAGTDALSVGETLSIDLGGNAGGTFSKDKKIVFTTGEASIVLDGPNLYIDAKAILSLRSGDALSLNGGDVQIDGQPSIKLNGSQAAAPSISLLDGSHYSVLPALLPAAPPLTLLDQLINSPLLDPGQAPGELSLPPEVEAQLAALRNKILAGLEEIVSKIESAPDLIGQDVLPEVEAARAAAEARIEAARKWLASAKARIAEEIEKWKAELLALKARIETAAAELQARIKSAIASVQAKITEIRDRARETLQAIKDKIQTFKDDIKSRFDALRAQAIELRNKVMGPFEEIRNGIKQITQQVKDTVAEFKQTILGVVDDVKTAVKDVKDQVAAIKKEVQDLFGLKSAYNDIKNDVKETVEGVKEAWNETKQAAKDAVDDVKSIFDGTAFSEDPADDGAAMFKGAAQGAPPPNGSGFQAPPGSVDNGAGNALNIPQGAGQGAGNGAGNVLNVPQGAGNGAGKAGANALHIPAQGKPLHGGIHRSFQQPGSAAGKGAARAAPHASNALQSASHSIATSGGHAATASPGSSFDLQQAVSHADSAARQNGSAAAPAIVAGSSMAVGIAGAVTAGGAASLPQNPLAGSTVVTRSGGFTPGSVVDVVNGTQTPALLQSPSDGQLLVLRTQQSQPLSAQDFTKTFVDHQMDGLPPSDAYTAALQSKGYLVYERPWDGWLQTLIKKVVL